MVTTASRDGPAASTSRRVVLGLLAAATVAGVVLAAPTPAGLRPEGQRMAALFLVALILWITEALPVAVTALLVVLLQPIFRVAPLSAAIGSFISPVFFFVLTMFVIAAAIVRTGLDRRFALWLLARAGADSRRVVLALMIGTAAISTIMSDVAACAIFMAVALGILDKARVTPGASQVGKAMMIGIPVASLIGGVGTPAGSSINILGIYFIEQYGKVRVPFLSWTAIGLPMVVVLVPFAWWVLVRRFPPEMAALCDVESTRAQRRSAGPLGAGEKRVLSLLSVMIVLWIASTWIRALDVVLIAIGGAVVLFLPGFRLFTWKEAERAIGWDSILMIGGVTSLGAASVQTDLARWLVEESLGGLQQWPAMWAVAGISAFTVVIHLVLPIGPVVNTVMIPPIALLALATGQNPALYGLPVAFTASCAFLLPLDAVPLLTYSTGYYRMLDMLTPGAIISVAWVVWITVLVALLGPWLGLA